MGSIADALAAAAARAAQIAADTKRTYAQPTVEAAQQGHPEATKASSENMDEAVRATRQRASDMQSAAMGVIHNIAGNGPEASGAESYSYVGDGGFVQDLSRTAEPPKREAQDIKKDDEDNSWINDLGQIQYADGPQAGSADFGQVAGYFDDYMTKFDTDANNRYEQAFDKQAMEANKHEMDNATIIGDNGQLINPLTGMAPEKIDIGASDYSGTEVMDDLKYDENGKVLLDENGNRVGFTDRDARAAYMTPEAARWYAENGYFDDAEGALEYLDKHRGEQQAVSKQRMEELFGFDRYERNAGERLADDLNAGNERLMDNLYEFSNIRSKLAGGYNAVLGDGTRVKVTPELRRELEEKLQEREQQAGYKFPDGSMLTMQEMNYLVQTYGMPQYAHMNGDWYLAWGDDPATAQVKYLGSGGNQPPEITMSDRKDVTTSDGTTWSDEDIVKNFKDLGILKWFIDTPEDKEGYADIVKDAQDEAGSKADFGWFNLAKPREYMSDGMFDTLSEGKFMDVIPQTIDMLATSAPYFNPLTAGITGMSQMVGDLQGVQMQGANRDTMGTVNNVAVAAPLQGLATIGESALGGGAAGRLGARSGLYMPERGVFETIGDKAWENLRRAGGRTATPNPLKRNALTRTLREGVDEGLEEVATSPLYEAAEQGIQGAYTNEKQDEYGWNTGERDMEGTVTTEKFKNWIDSIPNDFMGGMMLGGPMGGLKELNPSSRKQANSQYNIDKELAELGIKIPANRESERLNNGK